MITTLILIYFAINIFIAGYGFSEDSTWESVSYTRGRLIFNLFFGSCFLVLYPLLILFPPISNWIKYEIIFWYRFKFTNYWQGVLLDDEYSEEYKSREEKLEKIVASASKFNKQSRRHSKIIYNKYK